MDAEPDEFEGPLRLTRVPIAWEYYEPGEHGVKVFTAGRWSYDDLAEVEVEESEAQVVVTLYRRVVAGLLPDGSGVAENAAGKHAGRIEVPLATPLAERGVRDGSDPRRPKRARLNRQVEEGEWEWFAFRDEPVWGCPLWEL